jgi:transposase
MTYRESLRDIETCLRAMRPKLYHMGIRGKVSRSTLADANEHRDWRIFAEFAQVLIATARDLYAGEDFGAQVDSTVYALDSTTIDLCLALFPWARFRKNKGAVKLHTLLNLRGSIPEFVHISEGRVHDVNILDVLIPEAGACYIMDRGYIDFARLHQLHAAGAFFVTRPKKNLRCRRRYSRPVDKSTGLGSDQTVMLIERDSAKHFPDPLRRVRYTDEETGKRLTFLTNHMGLPALIVAELYKARWRVELFFKWIKQHLRIKAFYGTSENAVKTQVWIAVSVYVLVAIIKKRLQIPASLYTILQVLSIASFEKTPIFKALSEHESEVLRDEPEKQLWLL